MKRCCRCNKAAGFWVMAKDAQVVRRPWCLSCIDAFVDRDAVRMTTIETAPRADRHSPLMPSLRAPGS